MARPSTPRIVREIVLQQALDLIEEEGYEGFSLPRLAKRLGVRPPSLYHHFAHRAQLLTEATRTVIDSVQLPPFDDFSTPWREWCVDTALAMRDMILARPRVAPVVMWYLSTIGVPELHEQCVEHLRSRGIPATQCTHIVDSLERMTLGTTSVEAMRNRVENPRYDGDASPDFSTDVAARDRFEASLRTFLAGVTVPGDDQENAAQEPDTDRT